MKETFYQYSWRWFIIIHRTKEDLSYVEYQNELLNTEHSGYIDGYNRAISDFTEKLNNYSYGRTNGVYIEIPLYKLKEISDQLKIGGNE